MISDCRLAQVSSSESLTAGCSFVGLGVILPIVMCVLVAAHCTATVVTGAHRSRLPPFPVLYLSGSHQPRTPRMDIDDRIARTKDLIQKREEIDAELAGLFGLTVKIKKSLRCSKCGEEGH